MEKILTIEENINEMWYIVEILKKWGIIVSMKRKSELETSIHLNGKRNNVENAADTIKKIFGKKKKEGE